MTTIEQLSVLQDIIDHDLPDDRLEMLDALLHLPFSITYEEICEQSYSFRHAYPVDTIRSLLRQHAISGKNLELEVQYAKVSEEERLLLYLFFKNKCLIIKDGHIEWQL